MCADSENAQARIRAERWQKVTVMKRKMIVLALVCSAALAVAGCGQNSGKDESAAAATTSAASETEAAIDWENDPMAYLSGINVSDYVELPKNYNAMTVEVAPVEPVTDEQVQQQVDSFYQQNRETVEVTNRKKVQEGDVVNIDYVGSIDGKEFDGGSAEGYDLEIGSGSFIEGFEQGLIDHEVGEEVTLDLTFPEDYSDTTKAGKKAQFAVTINSISEYEPLTDEMVARMGETDEFGAAITTVDAYSAYIKNKMTEQNEQAHANEVSSAITQALVDACTFKQDPPAAMVERIYQSFIEQLTYTAQMYGLDLKTLMTLYGSTEDTYEQDIRNEALAQTKQIIALQAVAEKENLLISDKDFEAELQEAVDRMNAGSSAGEASTEGDTAAAAAEPVYSSIEDVPQSESESYREYLDRQEAIRFLNEKTTITEPAAEEGATTQAPAQENAGAAATEAAAAQEKTEDSAETAK